MEKEKEITILMPTMDRPDFLARALGYYKSVSFKGCICIGDSSNAENAETNTITTRESGPVLNIIYRHFPNPPYLHDGMCIRDLINLIPTPYAVFAGDDDFAIPKGLEECANFLDEHNDYSAARGKHIQFRLKSGGVLGEIAWAFNTRLAPLEFETAARRWVMHMRYPYSTQYAVHRRETWHRMYRDAHLVPARHLGADLLPCSLSVISGKVKNLNCIFSLSQINYDRVFDWSSHGMYSLIMDRTWSASIERVRTVIVEALVEKDGISTRKAQEIFDREMSLFVMGGLKWQYEKRYSEPARHISIHFRKSFLGETFKAFLGKIPGMSTLVGNFRKKRFDLLFARHTDFIPVYSSIKGKSKK